MIHISNKSVVFVLEYAKDRMCLPFVLQFVKILRFSLWHSYGDTLYILLLKDNTYITNIMIDKLTFSLTNSCF